jgi:GTP-binding protein
LKITDCRFERAACRPEDEPRTPGPEIVFLGRSNVGKSSLINRLLGVRKLARTSSQPGRTRSINFYRINESFHFVDLPGYGYSKAPKEVRRSWGPMIEGYLERRHERITLAILLVDARHPVTELDLLMAEWLEDREIEYLTAATKADKLSGNARAAAKRQLREAIGGARQGVEPILTSARTGLGIREIWSHLDQVLGHGKGRSRARPA